MMRKLLGLGSVLVAAVAMWGQSVNTGAVLGTISDQSGAVVPHATVTAKNDATGTALTTQADEEGFYRFSFLEPGTYEFEASATGFHSLEKRAPVYLGQTNTVDFRLPVGTAKQSVTVTGDTPLVQEENANLATSFSQSQLRGVPNPGNDLTFVVQASPGVVMDTQQGLGSFSTYGLPATSNVFTVNGMQDNNPFLNLNNAGATNLLLGLGEVQELTVINNAYSGEYGSLAGAQVSVVTKSGTNALHGDAGYWWNGRVLNANDWFNNHTQPRTPKSFDNANQWSAGLGGPIKKDKTFFFLYTEGLRVVIPTSNLVLIPSSQFEAATISNLNSSSPPRVNSAAYYQNVIFPLYNNAPGAAAATPSPFNPADKAQNGGCKGSFFAGGLGTNLPCTLQFQSTINNLSSEWLLSARVDQNLGSKDRLFGRFRTDHGSQATYTDPISREFNIVGNQPQYEGQFSETHTFGATVANNFVMSAAWMGATLSNPDRAAALRLFPTTLQLGDGTLSTLGGIDHLFPQGRNTTQYGLVDDVTWQRPRHGFKFGVTYQRYDITDLDFPLLGSGIVVPFTLNDFFNGGNIPGSPAPGDLLVQNFFTRPSQPLASYRLGAYLQDEIRVLPNLKLTASLRLDHDSVPVCQTRCFSLLAGDFSGLNRDFTTPYNQLIRTARSEGFSSSEPVAVQPRLGLAWAPYASHDFVVHAGVGLFNDAFPAAIADRIAANPPLVNSFNVRGDFLAPTEISNLFSDAMQANAAFTKGYAGGASFIDLKANPFSPFFSPFFIPPNVENPPAGVKIPRYLEWSADIQKGWGPNTVMKIAYVANHGIHELVQNNGVNGFCVPQVCPFGFAGLPSTPPDPRFGTVNQVESSGVSNYNGLTASVQHRMGRGLQVQANYTWSHAFDDVSNGGLLNFNFATNTSLLDQEDPANLRRFNYGNADYDVRHYLSLSYVYAPVIKRRGLNGWEISGSAFARTGMPFSVIDSITTGLLNQQNYGGTILANVLGPAASCGPSAAGSDSTPCLTSSQFSPPPDFVTSFPSGFGNQRRNQFRGPAYFDTDLAVSKTLKLPRWERGSFSAGMQFFNLTNHPNFDQPVANIADPNFGHITHTVSPPTTVLGSFLGGDASPRVIRVQGRFTF